MYHQRKKGSGTKNTNTGVKGSGNKANNQLESVRLLHSLAIFCPIVLGNEDSPRNTNGIDKDQKDKVDLSSNIHPGHLHISQACHHKVVDKGNHVLNQ